MSTEKTKLQKELEELDLRRAAIKTEIAETAEKDADCVVYRRSFWNTQTPQRQHEILADVGRGAAQLID
jgi:hypothetical protein